MNGRIRAAFLGILCFGFAFGDYIELGGDGTALLSRPFCGN
jgi:hypothetical protein